jgi:hypothetical protein
VPSPLLPKNIPHSINAFPFQSVRYAASTPYSGLAMATDRQIQANRANSKKSTGPKTPEGKRNASKNGTLHRLLSETVVLKGESLRRFNDLAASLILQFEPRNPAEAALVRTMASARWRLVRMWGFQTAAFQREMARHDASAESGAARAAAAFQSLADNSRALALQHRLEATFDRQYNQALAMLLKLRQAPAKTWMTIFKHKPILKMPPNQNPLCN